MSTRFDIPEWLAQEHAPASPPVDDHRIEELVNRFIAGKQEALFTAPDAFYRREGGDAVDGAPATAERLQGLRDALLEQARDDGERAALGPRLDAQIADERDGIGRHLAAQRTVHRRQIIAERQGLIRRAAELEPDDDDKIAGLADAHASAVQELARLDGLAPDSPEEAGLLDAARSEILRAAIEQRIAARRPGKAVTLYDRVKAALSPADRRALDLPIGVATDEAATDAWLARETDADGVPLPDRARLDEGLSDRQRLILLAKIGARDSAEESHRFATVKGLDHRLAEAIAAIATQPARYRPGTLARLAEAYADAGATEQADATRRLGRLETYFRSFAQVGAAAQQRHLDAFAGPERAPERAMAEAILRHQDAAFARDSCAAGAALHPEVGPPLPEEDAVRQERMIKARRESLMPTSIAPGSTSVPAAGTEAGILQNRAVWTDRSSSDRTGDITSDPHDVHRAEATPDDFRPLAPGSDPNQGRVRSNSPAAEAKPTPANELSDQNVRLPDGSQIPNPFPGPRNRTGFAIAPVDDLKEVAAAGRRDGERFRKLKKSKWTYNHADTFLVVQFMANIGTGGRFDHQRRGNLITGFEQLRQFRPIANVNVGLYCQQFGLSLEETLYLAGTYARNFSSNADPKRPSGLDEQTEYFIREGYRIGQTGMFGPKGSGQTR